MTWVIALQLMLKYGPEAVQQIIQIINDHPEPTKEAFDSILTLALKPLDEYIKEAELRKVK